MTKNTEKSSATMPLLSDTSIKPIQRYANSYNKYFARHNSDHLLAMILHPYFATEGFAEPKITRHDGASLLEQAKSLLTKAVDKATHKKYDLIATSDATEESGKDG